MNDIDGYVDVKFGTSYFVSLVYCLEVQIHGQRVVRSMGGSPGELSEELVT